MEESIFPQLHGDSVPSNYSRRGALSTAGAGLLVGLAGCTGILRPSRTRIGEVVFLNLDDTVHTVRLLLRASDETLYQTTQRVPDRGEMPVLTHQDGLPTAKREYTVIARLADGSDSIQRTYPTDRGGDCYSVTVRIDFDGTFRDMPIIPNFDGCTTPP